MITIKDCFYLKGSPYIPYIDSNINNNYHNSINLPILLLLYYYYVLL